MERRQTMPEGLVAQAVAVDQTHLALLDLVPLVKDMTAEQVQLALNLEVVVVLDLLE